MAKATRASAVRRPIGRRTGASGRRLFWGLSLAVGVLCGLALFHVWIRVASYERSLRKGALTAENLELSSARQSLTVEVNRLKAAQTVRREALESLGMGPPVEVIVIPAERTAEKLRDAKKRSGERTARATARGGKARTARSDEGSRPLAGTP